MLRDDKTDSKAMRNMKDLGLTEYEVRLYIILVSRTVPTTASEICRLSGVPYTRTYSVLSSLKEKGLVEIMRGKPILYKAVEPEAALSGVAREMITQISTASKGAVASLKKLRGDVSEDAEHGASWNITGKRNLTNKFVEELEHSKGGIKVIFPNLSLLDARVLERLLSTSQTKHVQLLVSPEDKRRIQRIDTRNAEIRYNGFVKSRYALFDDRRSLMIAVENQEPWTGVFETCRNCARQAYEHFDLAWKASTA